MPIEKINEATSEEYTPPVVTEFEYTDRWAKVKRAARNTIGRKGEGKYPDAKWKKNILLAEHSPIRRIQVGWMWVGLKSWVSVHFVRHWLGIVHWVRTQRTDRTGKNRDGIGQGALVEHECEANAQTLINISRKRLCTQAAPETREAWQLVKDKVKEADPVLGSVMVRECVYRGFCPEMYPCGYTKTEAYQKELATYRNLNEFCEEVTDDGRSSQ